MIVSFFFLKNNYKTKKINSSCRASKWQFPLALTELPLVNTSGCVQFSSPDMSDRVDISHFVALFGAKYQHHPKKEAFICIFWSIFHTLLLIIQRFYGIKFFSHFTFNYSMIFRTLV